MSRLGRGLVRATSEISEGVRIALANLVGARLRSFLTTLGIVIGVMTVIAIVAIIQGLNASFESQISTLGAHTVYVSKFAFIAQGRDEWWEMRNRKDLGRRELEAIERDALHATAIARALVGEPSLLLADEPTGNLDSATGDEIIRLFDDLHRRGHTIILVTHEPRLAARCPRAIRLTDGRVVGDGPGTEVAALGTARVVHG